jgi:N6-L-threonylcarbamoyladenine synthase
MLRHLLPGRSLVRSLRLRQWKSRNAARNRLILAIESSCDDSCVAVVASCGRVLAERNASQLSMHAAYGGVVPSIAKRAHRLQLPSLISAVMRESRLTFQQLDGIAVTVGPGLAPCLVIGLQRAKSLARRFNLPLFPVNHVEAHALSPWLQLAHPTPMWSLVLSGGHSCIFAVKSANSILLQCATLDDAMGEAFDKAAVRLNLPGVGGGAIERAAAAFHLVQRQETVVAQESDSDKDKRAKSAESAVVRLPIPLERHRSPKERPAFSFSGLKSALRRAIEAKEQPLTDSSRNMLAASFQQAAVTHVIQQVDRCLRRQPVEAGGTAMTVLGLGGGVAINKALRQALQEWILHHPTSSSSDCHAALPTTLALAPLKYCGDNAVMIGRTAMWQWRPCLPGTVPFEQLDIEPRGLFRRHR